MVFVYSCLALFCMYFFCFFKQKTAYEMRISDWSSDVCSSDLPPTVVPRDGDVIEINGVAHQAPSAFMILSSQRRRTEGIVLRIADQPRRICVPLRRHRPPMRNGECRHAGRR